MTNKIKVVHLMTSYGGGISSFILNKAEALQHKNIIFDVITFDNVSKHFRDAVESTNGKVIKIANPKNHGIRMFFKEVDEIFRSYSAKTIIHSHFGMNLVILFYFIAKKHGIKRFIIHAHTSAPGKYNSFKRRLNAYFSKEKISASLSSSANVFGERVSKYEPILHIPNSINPKEYLADKDKKTLKKQILGEEASRKKVIGHIGRFDPIKNHEFMIELIDDLVHKRFDFLWVFIGDGKTKDEIQKKIDQKKLSEYVVFLGRRDDMGDMYKMMDIVVLPSFYEGLPTVAIESQAAGTPIILSDAITQECDLDIDLVDYISLNDKQEWINKISQKNYSIVSKEKRLEQLVNKKFTNEDSAELYKQFLEQKIKSYYI